ncbi:hypothetical protein Salmuc_04624 [Salipiger mucosus DSM 16094]|uniref:Uncharacterized protein n=1 Tax=Salipiger mucosus DSM 16094 TaxID=1123237 RepID=S9QDL1_9RHOB|nr:hypothetical protein Salmuc_04624 [Salipiger mucosus DSM 16094]
MEALFVPLSVDGLRLSAPLATTGPMARVDRLPWRGGGMVLNPDMPWFAAALEAPPFAEPTTMLPPGIHLHWALPDALTCGAGPQGFPVAADRWHVSHPGAAWLVESDHAAEAPGGGGHDQTLFPRMAEDGRPPWRAQGRRMAAGAWPGGATRPVPPASRSPRWATASHCSPLSTAPDRPPRCRRWRGCWRRSFGVIPRTRVSGPAMASPGTPSRWSGNAR